MALPEHCFLFFILFFVSTYPSLSTWQTHITFAVLVKLNCPDGVYEIRLMTLPEDCFCSLFCSLFPLITRFPTWQTHFFYSPREMNYAVVWYRKLSWCRYQSSIFFILLFIPTNPCTLYLTGQTPSTDTRRSGTWTAGWTWWWRWLWLACWALGWGTSWVSVHSCSPTPAHLIIFLHCFLLVLFLHSFAWMSMLPSTPLS